MIYLAAAYSVFWAVTFGYVFSISARLRRTERELDELGSECCHPERIK
jgi:CcmD family protein